MPMDGVEDATVVRKSLGRTLLLCDRIWLRYFNVGLALESEKDFFGLTRLAFSRTLVGTS